MYPCKYLGRTIYEYYICKRFVRIKGNSDRGDNPKSSKIGG